MMSRVAPRSRIDSSTSRNGADRPRMDNVTHSLAGLVVAESAVRLRPRYGGIRTLAAISSMIAANLPDSDLLYTGTGGNHLAYMLHHRGYTHTVVVAIV